jgi:N-acetylglucosaminyl-diphospho-decaprenol L-rhamnosyltransferase
MTTTHRPDVSVVLLAHSEADGRRLGAAVASVRRSAAGVELETVVVANGAHTAIRRAASSLPRVVYIECENRGYGHGNNVGFDASCGRHVLFLNPDVEILEGSLEQLVGAIDADPRIGVVGVRQVDETGAVRPTIRRTPSPLRTLGDALGAERWPLRPACLLERELDPAAYTQQTTCDWLLGSFLLTRRLAFVGAGRFDPSFFLYSEEADLARRMYAAGWTTLYTPAMTIRHYGEEKQYEPGLVAQNAFSRVQYADKHLTAHAAALVRAGLILKYLLRLLYSLRAPRWRRASLASLAVVVGLPAGRRFRDRR